jgi:hypothetical protein
MFPLDFQIPIKNQSNKEGTTDMKSKQELKNEDSTMV